MYSYAVALEKGGCGKTALAVNLAAAFGHIGLSVLLIDLDSQASASHWLGVPVEQISAEASMLGLLSDAMKDKANAASVTSRAVRTADGIAVLPAHELMAGLPAQLAAAPMSGLFLLKELFIQLDASAAYDVVVLDLPPARGPVLAMALAAATRCIVPVQPEDLVMRAVRSLLASIQQVKARAVNADLQTSIVRNKYAPRSIADRTLDTLLREEYAALLLTTIFPVRSAMRDSALMQQSVFRYAAPDAVDVRHLFIAMVDELITLDGGRHGS